MLFGFDFQNIQYNHYFYEGSTSGPDAPPLSILNPVYYQYIPTPDFMLGSVKRLLWSSLSRHQDAPRFVM